MAEELQHLIDRIRDEAVDEGKKNADALISKAKEKAAAIVREAEETAKKSLAKAEKDAEIYTVRSTKALDQAARDLLITVGQGVENILSDLVGAALDDALGIEVLEKMMVTIAEAYAKNCENEQVELLINEKDQKDLIKFFAGRYKDKMIKGIEIHTDNEILKGFKVGLSNGRVYQDFTKEAIAEALINFLRPHLAEVVSRAAQEGVNLNEKGDI